MLSLVVDIPIGMIIVPVQYSPKMGKYSHLLMSNTASFSMEHKQAEKRGCCHMNPVPCRFDLNARLIEEASKRINDGLPHRIYEATQPTRGTSPKIIQRTRTEFHAKNSHGVLYSLSG